MKHLQHILYIALLLLTTTACTHNDGDIGPWFGTWHVEEITIDGTALAGYSGEYFFQFQSSVFCFRAVEGEMSEDWYCSYGHWSEDTGASTLTITFPDQDEIMTVTELTAIGFDLTGTNVMHIDGRGSSTMTLTMTNTAGHRCVYTLKKWG